MSTHPKYSYDFGQNVVERFTEKYARATYFLADMLEISHEDLCFYLIKLVRSDNQVQWEAMKRVIKACQRESFHDFKRVPVADRRKYLTIVKWNAQDEAISRLERSAHGRLPLDS